MNKKIILFGVILSLSIFLLYVKTGIRNNGKVCPLDAKICSDGSYVGREGKECQFKECPIVITVNKDKLIQVFNIKEGQKITSPLKIEGKARGYWFFEASFPIVLTDWDGLIISQGIATAKSEWMTEDFVPFEAELEFVKPKITGDFSKKGYLILKKDNPSGLKENDDFVEFLVYFE